MNLVDPLRVQALHSKCYVHPILYEVVWYRAIYLLFMSAPTSGSSHLKKKNQLIAIRIWYLYIFPDRVHILEFRVCFFIYSTYSSFIDKHN